MRKINKIVWKETKYIAAWILILSAVMQAVFLMIGKWDYTVLLGNLLSGATAVLNFLGMGMTVQDAVEKDEAGAKQAMKASGMIRTFFLFVAVVVGVVSPWFHTVAVIIPLFFPRITITLRAVLDNKKGGGDAKHEK